MEHTAHLNSEAITVGTSLVVEGTAIFSGDEINIKTQSNKAAQARVRSFGLGRLVLEGGEGTFELRPWHKGDGELPAVDGPSSPWTVRGSL